MWRETKLLPDEKIQCPRYTTRIVLKKKKTIIYFFFDDCISRLRSPVIQKKNSQKKVYLYRSTRLRLLYSTILRISYLGHGVARLGEQLVQSFLEFLFLGYMGHGVVRRVAVPHFQFHIFLVCPCFGSSVV